MYCLGVFVFLESQRGKIHKKKLMNFILTHLEPIKDELHDNLLGSFEEVVKYFYERLLIPLPTISERRARQIRQREIDEEFDILWDKKMEKTFVSMKIDFT